MSGNFLPAELSPIKGYSLYQKISRFPELLPQMRAAFLEVLRERGIITEEKLSDLCALQMRADGVEDTEANRSEYRDALIDLLFANNLGADEVENHVNLVRKRDKCQELGRVVASDHATSLTIWQALREFCDIPKGELYISPEDAEGIRVSLLSYYISGQLPFIGIAKNHVTIRDIDTILGQHARRGEVPGEAGREGRGHDRGPENPSSHSERTRPRVRKAHHRARHVVHNVGRVFGLHRQEPLL